MSCGSRTITARCIGYAAYKRRIHEVTDILAC